MTTITYNFSGKGATGDRGTAKKDGKEYAIHELQTSWKLVSSDGAVKVEFVYNKKDFKTFDELKSELINQGYTVE